MNTSLSEDNISKKLTQFFMDHLPITQFMGLDVESYDGHTLILTAPLEPNINDKHTAFGGSLYNIAVMACWGMVFLKTQEKNIECNQVVAEGTIKYIRPVNGRLRAICHAPKEDVLTSFFECFEKKGKASISVESTIYNDVNMMMVDPEEKPSATYSGKYAILKE